MPLEVNEIAIVLRVRDNREDDGGLRDMTVDADAAREKLVEECVRRVLQALKAERER